MTITATHAGADDFAVSPQALVLATRPIARRIYPLPVFRQDRWRLDAALFEPHADPLTIDWSKWPTALRPQGKTYAWLLLNPTPSAEPSFDDQKTLSVRTVAQAALYLRYFAHFLADRGHLAFEEATEQDLNDYLDYVRQSPMSDDRRRDMAYEVVRLWSHRAALPSPMRLPAAPPWNGSQPRDLFGTTVHSPENKTPRIDERTMHALLTWCLRFVQDFAPDIIAAAHQYNRLSQSGARKYSDRDVRKPQPGRVISAATAYVASLHEQGLPLPGRINSDGHLEPHYPLIARHLDCAANNVSDPGRVRSIIDESGLPVAPKGYILHACAGTLDGQPWLDHGISFEEAPMLASLLRGAATVIVAYLSGMRPGEVLSLSRGCVNHDRSTDLWSLDGTVWKGATDEHGTKLHQGAPRATPWVVVAEVATAVAVMEQLHPYDSIFPAKVTKNGLAPQAGTAQRPSQAAGDIMRLIDWVNAYCAAQQRPEAIPDDRTKRLLSLSRFRRTLAWHICRRPRGLAAASLQYGHVMTTVTLGYAGNAASGFPDDYAFERFLARLDDVREDHHLLSQGEHVSGPAADVYRQRVLAANTEFEGVVFVSDQQAKAYLSNNALRLYEGRGLTCVHDPEKALCQQRVTALEPTTTPDLTDCQPNRCKNVARTDRDMVHVRERAALLREITNDPLAPPLRVAREAAELNRLNSIIENHERTRPDAQANVDG